MSDTFHAMFDAAPAGRPCVIAPDGRVSTYGEIGARSRALAQGFARLGIGRGDAVALWLANGADWLAVFLACARLGAMAVGVNARFRGGEIGELLRRTRARALVAGAQQGKLPGREIFATVPSADLVALNAVIVAGAEEASPWGGHAPVPIDRLCAEPLRADVGQPDDRAMVFTTSGTTRAPKLVAHVQRGIAAHGRDVAAAFGLDRPSSVVQMLVPFAGAFGFAQMLGAVAAGCPMVVPPAFDAGDCARLARTRKVTNMVGTDDMLDRMLAASDGKRPFPDLRFFGHANFNPALVDLPERAQERGVTLRGLFGMSETLALFAMQPEDAALARRREAGGLPVSPRGRARVRDVASGALAAPGVHGEIELKGPSLMAGYLDDEAATRAAFTEDGFLRTGDLGYATADGGFVHLGRMGDVLRLGGYLVNPLEIEATVLENPSLAACQVVEAQVEGGVRPVAFVIPAPGATVEEPAIIAHCRERLAAFKAPVRVVTVDAFPTVEGPNGVKVRRDELRRMAQKAVGSGRQAGAPPAGIQRDR
ncbi:MAG: AMP-binding protein [Alphaproteobacteria bacterium]|nr:AMP-binding protein [Alphaproteobacteria bacterium]